MIQKLFLVFCLVACSLYQVQAQTNKAAASLVQPTKNNTNNQKSTNNKKKTTTKKSYYIPANNEHVQAIKKKDLPYQFWVYTPEGYAENKDKKYPMILFLHGRSSSGTNLDMVKRYGVIYELLRGMKIDFVVAAPQCQNGWDNKKLLQVLDYVQDNYRVHKDSTYLTGMSMGGYGAWMLAGAHPERFAAVAPVCGGGDLKQVPNLIEMPTWVFHGAKDRAVPISESQKMVDAIKAKKGKKIQFTVYKNDGHGELIKVFRMPELYKWFLEHKIEHKDQKTTTEENKKSNQKKSSDAEENESLESKS